MLDGAPSAAADVGTESAFAGTAEPGLLGVRGYVAHSVLGDSGQLLGVLVGLDREPTRAGAAEAALLRGIADGLGRALSGLEAGPSLDAPEPDAAAGTEHEPTAAGEPGPSEPRAFGESRPSSNGPVPTGVPPSTGAASSNGPAPSNSSASADSSVSADSSGSADGPESSHGPVSSHGPGPAPSGPPSPATLAAAAGRPGVRPSSPRPAPPGRPAAPPRRPTDRPPAGIGPTGPEGSETRLRRSPAGWVVEGPGSDMRPVGDLVSAMVLADLLAEDLAPPGRPRRPDHELSETDRLRLSVSQLEHALASRVVVEQAIGVLAERHRIRPREAFERLRRTARGMGRRVHDLARQVVDSITDPRATLPGELSGRSSAPRPAPPRAGTPPRR
jgi:hypothetical protein